MPDQQNSRAGGAVTKLSPGAGAVITNYVSCSRYLIILSKTLRNFIEKSHVCINPRKKALKSKKVIFQASNKTICDKKKSQGRKNVRVGAGAGAIIRNYGSATLLI